MIQIAYAAKTAPTCSGKYFNRMITVVLENAYYTEALKQPFLASLAKQGTLFSNFHAETHPSQANYLAMIAGTTFNIPDNDAADDNMDFDSTHLGDLLEKAGLDWRAYAEGYPGKCFLEAESGEYARKHLPFLSFKNVQKNPKRCAKVVNSSQFDSDLKSGKLLAYSLYVLDLKNDGHEPSTVKFADSWLSTRFKKLLTDESKMKCTLFVVTFDEADPDKDGKNRIYTAFVGPMVKAGIEIKDQLNHYSLFRLIEENWPKLGSLNTGDKTANQINGWNK